MLFGLSMCRITGSCISMRLLLGAGRLSAAIIDLEAFEFADLSWNATATVSHIVSVTSTFARRTLFDEGRR